ncbi:hypothetical protein U6A24_12735 [Aquimarina gracilis]|uniref:Uncharacterized protein n=1 Tax=Aquimarina gracilis TaxID=874422 RepID=A0ABU5ZWV0_9FLAO|nr:hypothetical protein [Aquimarina gracilis]MEB3346336.1 hypothetical protein [Aquimarina gracilis]
MIDLVKMMYGKVWDKQGFLKKLSEKVDNKNPRSLQNHWFHSGSIPRKYLQIVIDLLEETIKEQIEELTGLIGKVNSI